jgi:hypothetical protein
MAIVEREVGFQWQLAVWEDVEDADDTQELVGFLDYVPMRPTINSGWGAWDFTQ